MLRDGFDFDPIRGSTQNMALTTLAYFSSRHMSNHIQEMEYVLERILARGAGDVGSEPTWSSVHSGKSPYLSQT